MNSGWWMVRCCRLCPEVAARIWLCDHEPGLTENKIDRPFLQGQIGLDLVPPEDVWSMVWFCEAAPEERRRLIDPPPSDRAPRNGRRQALVTAPLALWKQGRARRIGAEAFEAQIKWLRWAEVNAPDRPDFTYRRPIDIAAIPVPRFQRRM